MIRALLERLAPLAPLTAVVAALLCAAQPCCRCGWDGSLALGVVSMIASVAEFGFNSLLLWSAVVGILVYRRSGAAPGGQGTSGLPISQ
jgi:hypothetical protein